MNAIKSVFGRVCVVLTLLVLGQSSLLAAYTPYVVPTDVGSMFDGFDVLIENFSVLFGVVVVAAVLVTGFFLGRKWLSRVG